MQSVPCRVQPESNRTFELFRVSLTKTATTLLEAASDRSHSVAAQAHVERSAGAARVLKLNIESESLGKRAPFQGLETTMTRPNFVLVYGTAGFVMYPVERIYQISPQLAQINVSDDIREVRRAVTEALTNEEDDGGATLTKQEILKRLDRHESQRPNTKDPRYAQWKELDRKLKRQLRALREKARDEVGDITGQELSDDENEVIDSQITESSSDFTLSESSGDEEETKPKSGAPGGAREHNMAVMDRLQKDTLCIDQLLRSRSSSEPFPLQQLEGLLQRFYDEYRMQTRSDITLTAFVEQLVEEEQQRGIITYNPEARTISSR